MVSSSSSDTVTVLVVTIVVLLLLLAVGGVLFLVCVLRVKASRRGRRERIYGTIQESEVIGTVRNESCGYFQGGRSEDELVGEDEEIHML